MLPEIPGEELVAEPHLLRLKAPAVQIVEGARAALEPEGELVGVESLELVAGAVVVAVAAVLGVAEQRMADGGEVCADLVGAAGQQVDLQQEKRPFSPSTR